MPRPNRIQMRRKTPIAYRIALIALVWLSAAAVAEKGTVHLDATRGKPGKHAIRFGIVTQNEAPQKTVAVFLSEGETDLICYRYEIRGDSVSLELLSDWKLPPPDDNDTRYTITAVRVSHEQYAASRNAIETHIREADTADSAEIRFYNCVSEVLRSCEMRLPYRSPYRPPDPAQWIGDIPDYNKDLLRKE